MGVKIYQIILRTIVKTADIFTYSSFAIFLELLWEFDNKAYYIVMFGLELISKITVQHIMTLLHVH